MRIAYLDQWVFVEMTKAGLGRDGSLVSIRDKLLEAKAADAASFPLSDVHYMETWKRSSIDSRRQLAAEMFRFSGFRTLAPLSVIVQQEMAAAVALIFRRPCGAGRFQPFGTGGAYAFGQIDQYADPDWPLDRRVLYELEFLSGGRDRVSASRDAEEFADSLNESSRLLATWNTDHADWLSRLRIQHLFEFRAPLVAALLGAGVLVEELAALGSDGLVELASAVPTVWAQGEMRRVRYPDVDQGFQPNDLNDLRGLARAIVYCDIVVADKAWVSAIARTDLAKRFGTEVHAKIPAAADAILS